MIAVYRVHHIVNKARIHVLSSIFQRFIRHVPQPIFDVFRMIGNIWDGFYRLVMHVPLVEERGNVLRRKNTPANRRNTRNGYRSRICLYIRSFLKNFGSKPFSMIDCRIKGVIIPTPHTVSHSLYMIFSFTA